MAKPLHGQPRADELKVALNDLIKAVWEMDRGETLSENARLCAVWDEAVRVRDQMLKPPPEEPR